MSISAFADAIATAQPFSGQMSGYTGRIIRGKKPEDFLTLTDDPTRKIVMLFGDDGFQTLAGKSGHDMLITLGYEPDYLRGKIEAGNKFKMVIFPETDGPKLAIWDNVIDMACEIYPDIARELRAAAGQLKRYSFEDIQRGAGYRFLDVENAGPSDHRYMTYDKYRMYGGTLVSTRAFFYHTLHLRELFRGDGYTYDSHGNRGMKEYIIPNRPLTELGDHKVVDIEVVLPSTTNHRGVNVITSASSKLLPVPQFFDPQSVREVRQVNYGHVANVAKDWRRQHNIPLAGNDRVRVGLLIVDAQNTFCLPTGELFVSGAPQDNERLCRFIYGNLAHITSIHPTLDTHLGQQIFHSIFWVNENGDHPAPATIITADEVRSGKWSVNPAMSLQLGPITELQRYAQHYVNELEKGGKYPLMIWPYHAMLGGVGHALVAGVEEACFFHNIVRGSQTGFEIKGGNPMTENYSIFRPEVLTRANGQAIAQKNVRFVEKLLKYDVVAIAGQAKSHCVAWAINDLLTDINASDPSLVKKVYLLEDCTSPVIIPGVIDFTQQANDAFRDFANAGMHIVRSTDPIETWPGVTL